MLLLTVNLPMVEETRAEALRALRSLCGPVSALRGCRSMNVYQRQEPPGDLLVVQEWQDEASLDAHVRSDAFMRLLLVMDLCRAAPDLRMYEERRVSGLEAVAKLRAVPGG